MKIFLSVLSLFLLVLFCHAIPYESDLAAYWSLNQSSGATMIDSTGVNNGTLYNMTSPNGWTSSGENNALSFDGVNDYVIVNHAGRLNFKSGDFSVGIWANTAKLGYYTGLISTDVAGDQAWKIYMDQGENNFHARYNNLVLVYPSITANSWHHYGYVKSGSILSIYMDGQFVASGSCPSTHPITTSELVLGSYRINNAKDGYYIYDGLMDEIGIWNRALNFSEMQSVYLDTIQSVTTVPEISSWIAFLLGIIAIESKTYRKILLLSMHSR